MGHERRGTLETQGTEGLKRARDGGMTLQSPLAKRMFSIIVPLSLCFSEVQRRLPPLSQDCVVVFS